MEYKADTYYPDEDEFRSLPLDLQRVSSVGREEDIFGGEDDIFRSCPVPPPLMMENRFDIPDPKFGGEFGASGSEYFDPNSVDDYGFGGDFLKTSIAVTSLSEPPHIPMAPYVLADTHLIFSSKDISSSDLLSQVQTALREKDADFHFDPIKFKYKATAQLEGHFIKFTVKMFTCDKDSFAVEFMKRRGDSYHWHVFYQSVCQQLTDAPEVDRESRPFYICPPCYLSDDEEFDPVDMMSPVVEMAKSKYMDTCVEGLRNLATVTKNKDNALALAESHLLSSADLGIMLRCSDVEVATAAASLITNVATSIAANQKDQQPQKHENKLNLCTIAPILVHSMLAYQATGAATGSKGHGDVFALTECVRALEAMSLTVDTASAVVADGVGIQALQDCLKVYGQSLDSDKMDPLCKSLCSSVDGALLNLRGHGLPIM